MMRIHYLLFFLLVLGCKSSDKTQHIIEKAISAYGGDIFNDHEVSFTFRKYKLTIAENQGNFKYSRSYTDTLGNHLQEFSKNGLTYTINDSIIMPSEKKSTSIIEGINSQVYFNMLPYKLNDPAVIKKYIAEEEIKGKKFHKIEVTFQQEGGGIDYEDRFLYWFDQEDYSMDFLAYEFHVNGGGLRFREAFNSRIIEGLVFQDYINYKPAEKISLDSLAEYFENGKLKKLSEIKIQNISVALQNP